MQVVEDNVWTSKATKPSYMASYSSIVRAA